MERLYTIFFRCYDVMGIRLPYQFNVTFSRRNNRQTNKKNRLFLVLFSNKYIKMHGETLVASTWLVIFQN